VDLVPLECLACGAVVMRDKYDKQRYCSKSCAARNEPKGFIRNTLSRAVK
jgi:hypothetical protein